MHLSSQSENQTRATQPSEGASDGYESVGKKVYTAGSSGMWWRPLQSPDRLIGASESNVEDPAKEVLVVEDESYLCDLIADVLEAEGHTVTKASNGREAMQRLGESTPDLILLDLMMPVMDGWEVMSALRREERLAPIPVVIITAIYDVKRTQEDTGAKAVLTKPFDIDQLADVVRLYSS